MKQQYLSNSGFVVFAVAAVLGLGHISLFPGVVASQGGRLFVVIYLFLLWTLGLCLMIGEVGLGQKFQKGPTGVSRALSTHAGWLSSLGRMSVVVMWMMALLIGLVTAWSLGYTVMGVIDLIAGGVGGVGAVSAVSEGRPVGELFFVQDFLGSIWWIAVLLLGVWGVSYAVVASRRRQMYVSQMLLWSSIVLVIVMIWTLRLPGGGAGVSDVLLSFGSIDRGLLLQMSFWSDMLVQLMVPLGVGYGVLMTLGGMKHRESKIVGLVIRVLSIKMVYMVVACLCVWAMWGAWTHVYSDIGGGSGAIRSGIGMLFATASELFGAYGGEGGRVMHVLWYMMLTGLGLSSLLVLMQSVVSELLPVMTHYTKEGVMLITMGVSALMTMICFVPTYGIYAFGLSETYVTGLFVPVLTIALCLGCLSLSKRLRAFILHRSRSLLQVYLSSKSIAISWLVLCVGICAVLSLQFFSGQFFAVDISAYPRAVQQGVVAGVLLLVLGAVVMGRSKSKPFSGSGLGTFMANANPPTSLRSATSLIRED